MIASTSIIDHKTVVPMYQSSLRINVPVVPETPVSAWPE